MLYRVKFNHHYSNDKDYFWQHDYLMDVPSFALITTRLKERHPEGYIEVLSALETHIYDGDIFELAGHGGAVG